MKVSFKHNFLNILTGWKNKSHTALSGVWKFWGYLWSEFRLKKDKWCKFISDTVLQNTASSTSIFSSWLSISRIVNSAQPIRILFSMFPFSLFLTRGKGKREKEKPFFLYTIIFFFFQVGCTSMLLNTGVCSPTRNWRGLY